MSLKTFLNMSLPMLTLLMAFLPNLASGTNSAIAKEGRWAEQVIDGLLDGDAIWLTDDSGHEFLGIFTQADDNPDRAVILAHGIGVHPNWPDVIYPLREGLLEHGITTLSIQMPILANDADQGEYAPLFSEAPSRFEAALGYLDEEGYRDIIIIGHSTGASMAAYYLSQSNVPAVQSFVLIGMSPGIKGSENIEALEKIKVPVMDLYGSEDLPLVLGSVEQRAVAGNKQAGFQYLQIRVDGANHFYQGHEEMLVKQVIEWLEVPRN